MRILSILAAAAIGLAGTTFANAQATNTAPQSGTAKSLSGTGSDTTDDKGTAKAKPQKRATTGQKPQSAKPTAQPSMAPKGDVQNVR